MSKKTLSIIDAVNQYEARQSWVLWRCPHEEHFCQLYVALDLAASLRHVWDHVNPEELEFEVFYGVVHNRLKSCQYAPRTANLDNIYFTVDNEEKGCLSSELSRLFSIGSTIFFQFLKEEQNDGISALETLDASFSCVISFDEVYICFSIVFLDFIVYGY